LSTIRNTKTFGIIGHSFTTWFSYFHCLLNKIINIKSYAEDR